MSQIGSRKPVPYDKTRAPKKPTGKRERFPELKDEGLRAFVRKMPCIVCTGTPTQCAHVMTKGAAGGDRDNVVPLCGRCHAEQHRIGVRSFEYRYQVRLKVWARKVTAAYMAQQKAK